MLTVQDQDEATLKLVQEEQAKDEQLMRIVNYLSSKELPADVVMAKQVVELAKKSYVVVDGVLYYEGADVPGRKILS